MLVSAAIAKPGWVDPEVCFNHHIGTRLELKDVDLDRLDFIDLHGPLNPSALARRAGCIPRP
jgi:hypothetical protein